MDIIQKLKKMIIKKTFYSSHDQNRMKNEGDILNSREHFFSKKNKNLYYLLKNRYCWMKDYINENDHCIELGAGSGLLKYFINNNNLKISDFSTYSFLDYKNIDALETRFPDNTFDKVISSNMIHHIAFPIKHFKEVYRVLKPNGMYIIQDINNSLVTQLILMLTRHESWDFTVDPTNEETPCNKVDDLWSANVALPNLIFDNWDNFNKKIFNKFELVHENFSECLIFLNSGGVVAKTKYIPLNRFFVNNIIIKLDKLLVKFPKIFAMQRSIVLKKIN
jgi:SAM-dependent methyltransferase